MAVSLAKELKAHRIDVDFVTVGDSLLKGEDVYEGFQVHRIGNRNGRWFEILFWLELFLFILRNRSKYDVFHAHGAHLLSSVVGLFSLLTGKKSIIKITMSNDDLSGVKKSIKGMVHFLFLKMIHSYIAISRDLIQELLDCGFAGQKIRFTPNGVDSTRFIPATEMEKKRLKQRLNLPTDKRLLLTVGVIAPRKNIGWLIRKWGETDGIGKQNFLLAVGPQSRNDPDGTYLGSIKAIVVKNRHKMQFLDYVENIEDYYKAADVFVLPSKNEGLPNVVLEAMASGIPCIAAKSKGTIDLINHQDNGFLYEIDNDSGFADIISALNEEQVKEMGKKARMFVERNYSIRRIATVYTDHYRQLLQM